ncbi:MFS transporter small subunit [Streptomyces antibioticus]
MSQNATKASDGHTARIAGSWLIVGLPLVYGVVQAVDSCLPLFTR